MKTPLEKLRHHITGAIERGEKEAIVELLHPIESENGAILAGYTRELMAVNIAREVHIRVKPSTDLTGAFEAYNCDDCEIVRLLGYQWRFEELGQ